MKPFLIAFVDVGYNYKKTIKKYSKDIRAIKKIKSIDEFDKDFLKIIGF